MFFVSLYNVLGISNLLNTDKGELKIIKKINMYTYVRNLMKICINLNYKFINNFNILIICFIFICLVFTHKQ